MKNSIFHRGKKGIVLVLPLIMLATFPAYAAIPSTGAVLEGAKPPAVTQQPAANGPVITVKGQEPAVEADGQQKIPVKGFRIGGEPPLPADELLGLVRDDAGRDITLGGLDSIAGKITQYLHQKGYLVAFAYIPAQDIADGIVEIAVVPGKYGELTITGSAHISQGLLRDMLFAVQPGRIITREPLERALLLISDLNGISTQATLAPGKTSGTADLILETSNTAKISGVLHADNWGSRYTGRGRYGVRLTVKNPGSIGDSLTVGGLTTGEGIDNYSFGYSLPMGHDGAKIELNRSSVYYTLGEDFAFLDATGRAMVTSYNISYPFIRSRNFSLYGNVGYDNKHLRDDTIASHSSKTGKLWNVGLSGYFTDTWNGGSTNAFSLIRYQGDLDINDAAEAAADAAYLHTAGGFSKTVLTYQRQQYIAKNLNFNFSFIGQLAGKNLDSSEKLFLGGADAVRSYPQGEASGDQGCRITGELRLRMADLSRGSNNVYLTGFYDYGHVEINKHPYISTDENNRTLRGAGLGLLWTYAPDFVFRLDYAWKIGREQATADEDKNGRLWLQGMWYF